MDQIKEMVFEFIQGDKLYFRNMFKKCILEIELLNKEHEHRPRRNAFCYEEDEYYEQK